MRLRMMVCAAVLALTGAVTAFAHHSTANFDTSKSSTVTGKVTYFSFTNPHSFIDMEVAGEDGEPRAYKLFTVARTVMMRNGWEKEDLKPGDEVTVTGHPDKKDPAFMYLTKIVFASGKTWSRDSIE